MWRWHIENEALSESHIQGLKSRNDYDEEKFLLVQGDFFGIQSFIFAEGSESNKNSAKLLRGRSFYVSLLSELAALKVLDALDLPSTSQITNAAGKFIILAPNTPQTIEKLRAVEKEINEWFIQNMLATSGLGIVWTKASCNDFIACNEKQNFSLLMKKLFETMEVAKLKRFDLSHCDTAVLEADYSSGVNIYDNRLPANSRLPKDQILLGDYLVKYNRIVVFKDSTKIPSHLARLSLPIFGYEIAFGSTDRNSNLSLSEEVGFMRRYWDFSMPDSENEILWNGCARRNINGYVPRFAYDGEEKSNRYATVTDPYESSSLIKTFAHLACEDRDNGQGQIALSVLKGDIDNLGKIFQTGLVDEKSNRYLSFAKMAGLSRQINAFFTVYLPVLCKNDFPNTYTVFAGGDDFFLIGPWYQVQQLAQRLHSEFNRFVNNPEIHFSAGVVMVKPNIPPKTLAEMGEEALDKAKSVDGKNAVTIYSISLPWTHLEEINHLESLFETARIRFGLSSGYFYSLFQLIELSKLQATKPEASIWRSKLFYKTVRSLGRHSESEQNYVINEFLPSLVKAIETHSDAIRIPLSNFFYKLR